MRAGDLPGAGKGYGSLRPAVATASSAPREQKAPVQVAREEAQKEACHGLLILGKVVALLALLLLLTWLLTLHRRDHVRLRRLQRSAAAEATELRGLRATEAVQRRGRRAAERRAARAEERVKEQDGVLEEMGQQLEVQGGLAEDLGQTLSSSAEHLHRTLQRQQHQFTRLQAHLSGGLLELRSEQTKAQEAVQRANASAAALLEAKSTGADLARQLKAAEERQMESEEKVKVDQKQIAELRQAAALSKQAAAKSEYEARQHEQQQEANSQAKIRSHELLLQNLLKQLATQSEQRRRGEQELVDLKQKLQTKDRLAKDVAHSLLQMLKPT